jgi:hypothetical protein
MSHWVGFGQWKEFICSYLLLITTQIFRAVVVIDTKIGRKECYVYANLPKYNKTAATIPRKAR